MSICFTPYVHEATRGAWITPDAVRDQPGEFELSLSNVNGVDILLALGLSPEPNGGPIPLNTFASLVTAALRRHLGRRSPELAPSAQTGERRATIVFLGRRTGYVEERLGDLARLVQRCRAAGVTHLGWN